MTALRFPSLPVLAMQKSNGDAHPKLWESPSGKKPLLLQRLASTCKLLRSADSPQSTCLCKVTCRSSEPAQNSQGEGHCTARPTWLGQQQLHTGLLTVGGQPPATQPPGASR